jgi:hypothetical protein
MKRRRAARRREDRHARVAAGAQSGLRLEGRFHTPHIGAFFIGLKAGIMLLYDQPVTLVGEGAVAPGKRASRYVRLYVGKAIGRAARPQSLREGRNHLNRTEETAQ